MAQIYAAYDKGDIEELERLIRSGIDVNDWDYNDEALIHWFAKRGRTHIVKLLLDHGANIDCKATNLTFPLL